MRKIPIESIINIYDPNILWADLSPNYNGYQLSNTGILRSMKFYKKYPYGILIEQDNNRFAHISNSLNQTCTLDVKALMDIIPKRDYFIPTNSTYTRSRNPIITCYWT